MSSPSPNMEICTLAEYNYYLEERVLEAELSVGGLYLFMTKATAKDVAAIRCPARIQAMNQENDRGLIEFSLLSEELRPAMSLDAVINDGLLSIGELGSELENCSYFRSSGLVSQSDDHNERISESIGRSARQANPIRVLVPA